MSERPTREDKPVFDDAFARFWPHIADWIKAENNGHDPQDLAAWKRQTYALLAVAEDGGETDAFRLACYFDREGWEVNYALVLILADWDGIIRFAERAAVMAWVKAEPQALPLGKGAVVTLTEKMFSGSRQMVGTVQRHDYDLAMAVVYIADQGLPEKGGWLLPWEDLRAGVIHLGHEMQVIRE